MVKFAAASCILFTFLAPVAAVGNETILLDFASPQCPPCRQMEPLIQSLASSGYPIRKVDVTREQPLAQQYNVTRVPCFVMLADGREVDRVVGATSQQRLEVMFQRARDELARNNPVTRNQSPSAAQPIAGVQVPMNPLTTITAPATQGTPGSLASLASQTPSGPVDPQLVPLLNSSVRLRVEDGSNRSFGTGTIIDTRSGEALVITCGHLFRDSKGQAPVTVELFEATPTGTSPVGQVVGKVISYDLDRDIGLVSIRPGRPVAVAPVAPGNARILQGDRVASVGCSNGNNPSVIPTRVTQLNRYQGPPNIEAQGAPVEGRSGGGLFNEQGQLVGVCFAADHEGNEGLYAALESIHSELDRIGLGEIYGKGAGGAVEGASIPVAAAAAPPVVRGQEPHPPAVPLATAEPAVSVVNPIEPASPPASLSGAEQAALEEIFSRAATSEVICIIRPKEAGGQSEVITLGEVSPEFIQEISRQRKAADTTAR